MLKPRAPRWRRGFVVVLSVLMLAGGGALLVAQPGEDPPHAAPPPPRPIAWAAVEVAVAAPVRAFAGVVEARQRAPLSFEVAGRIATLTVDIGDRFALGDVLASLDARNYALALEERMSEREEAEAMRIEAAAAYDRQRRLHSDGWVSRAAYDQALAALRTTESRVARAEARLAIAAEDHADTVLTAPYDGRVARRLAEPSQQVGAGAPVLEVHGASGGLEVVVAVPETVVDRLVLGTHHRVTLPAYGGVTFDGVLSEIGAEATDRNAFPATLSLVDAPAVLRAGMTAEVALTLAPDPDHPAGPLLSIPVGAFMAGPDQGYAAFVFDPETATVRRRAIAIADIGGDRVLVRDGLDAGEIVATAGLSFLVDGEPATLLGDGPARYNR